MVLHRDVLKVNTDPEKLYSFKLHVGLDSFDTRKLHIFDEFLEIDYNFLSKIKFTEELNINKSPLINVKDLHNRVFLFSLEEVIEKELPYKTSEKLSGFALGYVDILYKFHLIYMVANPAGHGIGKLFINTILDSLKDLEIYSIYGFTDTDNEMAMSLYRKFADEERLVKFYEAKL